MWGGQVTQGHGTVSSPSLELSFPGSPGQEWLVQTLAPLLSVKKFLFLGSADNSGLGFYSILWQGNLTMSITSEWPERLADPEKVDLCPWGSDERAGGHGKWAWECGSLTTALMALMLLVQGPWQQHDPKVRGNTRHGYAFMSESHCSVGVLVILGHYGPGASQIPSFFLESKGAGTRTPRTWESQCGDFDAWGLNEAPQVHRIWTVSKRDQSHGLLTVTLVGSLCSVHSRVFRKCKQSAESPRGAGLQRRDSL